MYQFDLGWTSNDGCNLFALGWLSRIVATIDAGGGMDESPLIIASRLRNKKTQKNIRNLFMLISMFVITQEEQYERREEHETDPTD